jgi:hypothetical protein
VDPLDAVRRGTRQRQFEQVDGLPSPSTPTDGHETPAHRQVDPHNGHLDSQHRRRERDLDVLVQQSVEPTELLRHTVGIDGRLLDESGRIDVIVRHRAEATDRAPATQPLPQSVRTMG